ncbi:MAG: class I SAM-dependent methyltransferase [Thiogranum sp.]|nr:class I SAM-dependent methyltransferase [Thiogranum sp.]
MQRIPEPDLMDEPEQVLAYARADFSEPHTRFVELFAEKFGTGVSGTVLDLGCGPGDICRRFANAFPACHVHGIDGSAEMLALAETAADNAEPAHISYQLRYLPDPQLPQQHYHAVISNSLLHHLREPSVLWDTIIQCARPGAAVFIMDLLRPDTRAEAEQLVELYAADEPEILKKDFFNSLLAAYLPSEVEAQLHRLGLTLKIEVVSDRHFIAFGRLPAAVSR